MRAAVEMPYVPLVRAPRRRLLLRLAGLLGGAFVVHAVALLASGLWDSGTKADVAVVFGNTVGPDGRPSPRLAARLDRAIELYRSGEVPKIIASGGLGRERFEEAEVMARYLA